MKGDFVILDYGGVLSSKQVAELNHRQVNVSEIYVNLSWSWVSAWKIAVLSYFRYHKSQMIMFKTETPNFVVCVEKQV